MAKNIVLCSDGTGNQDIKNRGTNVFKLYEAVDIHGHKSDPAKTRQVAFYDDGVGTENPIMKVLGGAFGWGFTRNVKKMYRELVNVYEDGDRLFLFGFSRGAYTVRALAGFIQYWGVMDAAYYRTKPRETLTKKIDVCWKEFRDKSFRHDRAGEHRGYIPEEAGLPEPERIERRKGCHAVNPGGRVNIAFIGVWDTVGAIGSPFNWLRRIISRCIRPIWFIDNTLGEEVDRACQALSIDDERLTFHPELWNEKNGTDTRILQVWFSGVHSNVGGGYPKQGMSLVALDWMMTHAADNGKGLRFVAEDRDFVRCHEDVHDKLYDSRSGLGVFYRWSPRNIARLCADHRIDKAKIHASVFERIANGTNSYAPGNIPFDCEIDTTGSLGWPTTKAAYDMKKLLMRRKTGAGASLLEAMQTRVKSGIWSYRIFLVLTLLVLSAVYDLAFSRHWPWPLSLGSASVFIGCIGGIYLWADKVDSALYGKYEQFWHACRDELRQILS